MWCRPADVFRPQVIQICFVQCLRRRTSPRPKALVFRLHSRPTTHEIETNLNAENSTTHENILQLFPSTKTFAARTQLARAASDNAPDSFSWPVSDSRC